MEKLSQKEIINEGFARALHAARVIGSKVAQQVLPKNYALYKGVSNTIKQAREPLDSDKNKREILKYLDDDGMVADESNIKYDKSNDIWVVTVADVNIDPNSTSGNEYQVPAIFKKVNGQLQLVRAPRRLANSVSAKHKTPDQPTSRSPLKQQDIINKTSPSKIIPATKYTKLN